MIKTKIKNIYCGLKQNLDDGKKKYQSSYKKVDLKKEQYYVDELGFKDDTQSDKSHHGGVDKAVCVYPLKAYEFFKDTYGFDLDICSFGENFTIEDLDDSEVCLGDVFSCGQVLFEVSQPRQPCWKISSIVGIKSLTALVVKEYKTGFYFRVIKSGVLKKDDDLVLKQRKYLDISIEFINKCAFNAKENQDNIKKILEVKELAQAYRISLSKRYKDKEVGLQDWQKDDY